MIFKNCDCMEHMKSMKNNSVNFTLTDIPYDEVERKTNGLSQMKSLDTLGDANELKFDLQAFLNEVYRVSSNSICIFCGREQFSEIAKFFKDKPGTTRTVVYQKSNPVPSNGQYIYLSGIELAVWFKKRGAKTFNAYCKNPVFNYPIFGGKKRVHPTQKHPDLFQELIEDNTNEGDIVFDPCAGGGTAALAAHKTGRDFIGCELNKEYYDKAVEMLKKEGIEVKTEETLIDEINELTF